MAGQPQAAAVEQPPPSATDSPDVANKRAGWRKFPMVMRHPHFKPAVISNDRTVGPDGREQWVNAPPGEAIKFPPVTVLNEAQEELHKARGYVGSGDPVALQHAEVAPEPPGYTYQEYPRLLDDGSIDLGPDAPKPPDNFYPYWVRMPGWPDALVDDQEAHAELLRKRGVEGPPAPAPAVDPRDAKIAGLEAQLEELKALILAQARGQLGAATTPPPEADPAAKLEEPPAPAEDSTADPVEPMAEEAIDAELASGQIDDPATYPGAAAEIERELEEASEQPAKRKR